ncbi:helix-turn-helix domain-containing protein [Geodermatophilus sp. SYSU D00697]
MGARIGQRIRDLRHARGLDLRGLSEKLAEEGRPIKLGQLSKLELGQRRVDVDDLVALAVVLNVSPNQLLMPATSGRDDDTVSLTPGHSRVPWQRAWQWACGDLWLDDEQRPTTDDEEIDWYETNRPHDFTGVYNFTPNSVKGHEEAVGEVVAAARRAIAGGLTHSWVVKALNWFLAVSPEYQHRSEGRDRG